MASPDDGSGIPERTQAEAVRDWMYSRGPDRMILRVEAGAIYLLDDGRILVDMGNLFEVLDAVQDAVQRRNDRVREMLKDAS